MHKSSGADFTDFGGWTMPVAFDSIRQEHFAVRDAAGLFDVSHMSEVVVRGPDDRALLNRLTTNDVRALTPGDAQYTCFLNESGVIIDDAVVYRQPKPDGYLFVPNVGHGELMTTRLLEYANEWSMDVSISDSTSELALVAVQGPDAVETVDAVSSGSVSAISRFSCCRLEVAGVSCLVARTGYTGEDGVEIFVDSEDSEELWASLNSVQPCGLGARDTLRLEAGLLLSGQDFDPDDEPRTPIEAGLTFVVDFETEFVGRQALERQRESGPKQRLVGLRIEGRGIPRNGYDVLVDGERIGHVTSGTKSPTFNVPLAFCYVDCNHADPGTTVQVEVRDRMVEATVIDQRFLETLE